MIRKNKKERNKMNNELTKNNKNKRENEMIKKETMKNELKIDFT